MLGSAFVQNSLPPSASGVGKTELAKALASYLFNSEEAMVG